MATSLIGAYCAVRGISIVLGGFPDEKYLSLLLKHKEFNQIHRIFAGPGFVYLSSITMLFILGVLFQSKIIFDSPEHEKKEENKEILTQQKVE